MGVDTLINSHPWFCGLLGWILAAQSLGSCTDTIWGYYYNS